MKRKKIISGKDAIGTVTITIDMDTEGLGRHESERMMDALAGEAMALFQSPKIPFLCVPLVRLKVN